MLEKSCFAIPWSEKSLQDDLCNNPLSRIFVAEMPDGNLAGYISGWIVLDELQINNIAVAPEYRQRGVGRCLLDQLINLAQKEQLTSLTLEVRSGSQAARSLYESSGFGATGCRRGYYADNGEDAIIMQKIIGHK